MPSRLTAPSPRRSVRLGVSARPGETPPGPSGVLAAPLPGSGPGGPPARPEAAPPGPRAGRWTRDEQIGSLIRVADSRPDVGFMVRLLALCTLRRTDPGTRTHYVRRNDRLRRSGSPSRRPASVSGRSTARTSFRRRRRARDGTGLETGFGVVYADPNLGLIVDAALSLLVAHLAGGSTPRSPSCSNGSTPCCVRIRLGRPGRRSRGRIPVMRPWASP